MIREIEKKNHEKYIILKEILKRRHLLLVTL